MFGEKQKTNFSVVFKELFRSNFGLVIVFSIVLGLGLAGVTLMDVFEIENKEALKGAITLQSCTMSFSPSSIVVGQTSTLNWTTVGYVANTPVTLKCSKNNTSADVTAHITAYPNGSRVTEPYASSGVDVCQAYFNNSSTASCQATLTINQAAPSCTMSFSPASITVNNRSTLNWTTTNYVAGTPVRLECDIAGTTSATAEVTANPNGSLPTYLYTSPGTETCRAYFNNSATPTCTTSNKLTISSAGITCQSGSYCPTSNCTAQSQCKAYIACPSGQICKTGYTNPNNSAQCQQDQCVNITYTCAGNMYCPTNPGQSTVCSVACQPFYTPVSGKICPAGNELVINGQVVCKVPYVDQQNTNSNTNNNSEDLGSGSIKGTVFQDSNGNMKQDANEKGIPGVRVKLTWAGRDGKFSQMNGFFVDVANADDDDEYKDTTDKDGEFSFKKLPKGKYKIKIDQDDVKAQLAAKYILETKSDNNITLKRGEDYKNANFGYKKQNLASNVLSKAAPKTGAGTNIVIVLLISAAFTGGWFWWKKRKVA